MLAYLADIGELLPLRQTGQFTKMAKVKVKRRDCPPAFYFCPVMDFAGV
jgi:hypothetical protein